MKRILFLLLFLIAGCKESAETPDQSSAVQPMQQTGVVAEMVEVENYTYIRLEGEGPEIWIATLPVWVSEGDVVEFTGGIVMKDFHSESLEMTFDTILFVENLEVSDQPNGRDIVAEAHSSVTHNSGSAAPSLDPISSVDGGKTIAEIYDDYPGQDGKAVQLRARVVKVNAGILGKNWVTLQDGTGSAPNDRIVSTTTEMVAVGDIVDVSAMMRQDIDLGYGYEFNVLLEEASFTPVEQNQSAN